MNAMGEYNPYTDKCDLWALGILLYKLCFAKYPYSSANSDDREISQVLQEISTFEGYVLSLYINIYFISSFHAFIVQELSSDFRIKLPHHTRDPELTKLILQLLSRDPQNRPSVSEILQRPYVQKMIYTPPFHSSPPHSSTPSSSSPLTAPNGLRLRRTLTPSYPLLIDSGGTRPASPRKSKNSTVHSILSHTRPTLQRTGRFLSTFPISSLLYMIVFLVHIWVCFLLFSPSPPPTLFILPVVAISFFGFQIKRYYFIAYWLIFVY